MNTSRPASFGQILKLARAVPTVIPLMLVERLHLMIRSHHAAIEGVCLRCMVSSPCQPFMDATERVHEARIAVADHWASC